MRDKKLTGKKKFGWEVTVISILAFFAALLTGCSHENEHINEKEVIAVPMPEAVCITGFYIHHEGMAMEPYYLYTVTPDGAYMKMTDTDPLVWECYEDGEGYLAYSDTIKEEEHASLILVKEEQMIQKLEDAIVASGALGWDGYDRKVSKKGETDKGDWYVMYLCLSDQTTIEMKGYDVCPAGFELLLQTVVELFLDIKENDGI